MNGWVTNLLAQLGDYASVGQSMSVVDAGSFWTDAYFEETQLASIQEGDPANIKLGSSQRRRPLTGSIYRPLHRGR